MFEQLKDGHVIKTMVKEHEHILAMLDELQEIANKFTRKDYDDGVELMKRTNELVKKIIAAEPHHEREENVLFPELEQLGISGPPHIMRLEHEVIRKLKYDLKNETDNFVKDWEVRVESVSLLILKLCTNLSQHIDKENNILYPMALKSIPDVEKWEEMKVRCDDIGYCCFCPTDKEELNKLSENNK